MKKKILIAVLCVCIVSVGVFSFLLVRELLTDSQSRNFYADIAAVGTRPREPVENGSSGDSTNPPETQPAGWVPYVDFEALNDEIPGVVGWIILENTVINYPVMQYTDNEYFLTRLPDGTTHRNGSIFLDYRNENDFSDKSILIYGHHTRAGDMFGVLKNYRNQEFFEENPVIYLYTPEQDLKIALFAGHIAHSRRDHPPLEFETDEDFLAYIEHIRNKSVFNSDVEVTAEDRIISLVTCTYDFNNARLILAGIVVEG